MANRSRRDAEFPQDDLGAFNLFDSLARLGI